MRDHASGHTDWQAPPQRGLPIVDAPATETRSATPTPPPRPPISGWSPTSWRRAEVER